MNINNRQQELTNQQRSKVNADATLAKPFEFWPDLKPGKDAMLSLSSRRIFCHSEMHDRLLLGTV